MSTSQLKPALNNMQNGTTSTPSQAKGKKRERGDQSSDSGKRERSSKAYDGDSGSVKIENVLRSEAARLTEKGALVCFESVEKIVEFIQPNRLDNKLDLVSRSMVAGVIATTDRFDCLTHFVQLKGLSVLDEWLQDVHKGRIGEVGGSKEGEKPVEEFLFVLLRALDKLPVNLHALQTCNIGRSVNRLRSHRNLEIQKKARSLVDIWKKRVEAEMNVIDAKPVPNQVAAWPTKSNLPEVHGGRNSVGSYDVTLKSSTSPQSESKSGSVKSSTMSASEESQPRIVPFCGSDIQFSGRDENNGSSAPSQLISGNPFSAQEETRATTAGLTNANKTSGGSSLHRKSANGFLSSLGSQKEMLGRNSTVSRTADEKLQPCTSTSEKSFEVPVVEASSHKLIVKIQNRTETDRGSPAQSASGGSFGDPSLMSSRASSPMLSDVRESEHNLKEKPESYPMNMEPCHDSDLRDLQVESDDRGKCSAGFDEAQSKNVDWSRKSSEKCKASCSSLQNDSKAKQLRKASVSALNALIESCVKYTEANTPTTSAGDDLGMNLLASVAAREMCASDIISPADSALGNLSPDEEKFLHDELKSKPFSGDNHATDRCTTDSEEGIHLSKEMSTKSFGDRKWHSSLSSEAKNATAECSEMDGREYIEQQVKSTTSSLSTYPCPENEIDVKFESDTNLEARRDVTPDRDPFVSGKKGTKEQNVQEGAEKCSNNSFDQSEGQKLDCKRRGTSAAEDDGLLVGLNSDANEQKGDAMKVNAKNEVVTETCVSVSFLENESPAIPLHHMDGRGKLKRAKLSVIEGDKMEETSLTMVDGSPSSASAPSDMVAKMDFDLNEGLSVCDTKCGESGYSGSLSNANEVKQLPTVSLSCTSIPAAITVAAAAKGPFVPPVDLLRNKEELGWKGSATTSAFRPVEPRKFPQLTTGNSNVSSSDDCTSKSCRMPLDIDLNVADERLFEDMGCQDSFADRHPKSGNLKHYDNHRNEVNGPLPFSNSGGLDLDLNRVDDTTNILQYSTRNSHKLPSPVTPVKSLLSGSLSANEVKKDFDFDLNSGPGFDDVAAETSSLNPLAVGGTLSMNSLPVFGARPYSLEARNFSAWLPLGTSYSSVAIPSVLPDRGGPPFSVVAPIAPQRILGASGGGPFMTDMYRGSLISPSPAVPFASGPFPYQMFPFGTTLPLPSGTFSVGSASKSGGRVFNPALNSQSLAPVSEVTSQYPKPYMVGLHEDTSNGGLENVMKWSRPGLDLNAGPGVSELDGREDLLAQRQRYVSSSQAVAEEQGRIYPMAEGVLKRKEPEAGLDRETFRYKQSSWQ